MEALQWEQFGYTVQYSIVKKSHGFEATRSSVGRVFGLKGLVIYLW
jgi:hypothetical protein